MEDRGNVIEPTCMVGNSTEKATERPAEGAAEKIIQKSINKTTKKSQQAIDNDVNEAEPDKLEMTVAKIKRQQELVKDNMIYLTEMHLQNIRNQAQHQVQQLEDDDWDDKNSDNAQEDDEREEKLAGKVWERLSGNALNEEEAELGEFLPGRDMDREIMEGYQDFNTGGVKSRAVKLVYEGLKREVAEVIEGATLEVEVYGEHAEENLERYKSILADRITEVAIKDLSVVMGIDTVMGDVETTETAADAPDSVLSPVFDSVVQRNH